MASTIESPFSMEEIKNVVWDCGGDRSLGPDGFSFRFIRHFRDIFTSDYIDFVEEFYAKPYFQQVAIPRLLPLSQRLIILFSLKTFA